MSDDVRLAPGDQAPDFSLPDADGNEVSLSSLRGQHVIIYFYPAAMTPGCTKQACDFRDGRTALSDAGYAVLGISPDPPAKLAKFRDRDGLTFPLLSDPDRRVLKEYRPHDGYFPTEFIPYKREAAWKKMEPVFASNPDLRTSAERYKKYLEGRRH